jgi:hypothetical protein
MLISSLDAIIGSHLVGDKTQQTTQLPVKEGE